MERKRTRLRLICDEGEEEEEEEDIDRRIRPRNREKTKYTEDEEEEEESEEEEEEEDKDRRSSLRNRKRARYITYDYDYDDDDDDDEEEEEEEEEEYNNGTEEEENEQPSPSTQNTHDQRTHENGLLTVTCGNKTGTLDVQKLERSEACIKSQGRWFSPPAFEEFGGKASFKKWKSSIFNENKPLQFLFEQGALTTKGYKGRRSETTKQRRVLSSNHTSESSSEESDIQFTEDTEEDDVNDEDWFPGSEELLMETEEKRVGDENGAEVVGSGADESTEEEDKMEKGEMEDEDMAAVADNDSSVFEEREARLISSTPAGALLKKVEVVVRRLPEFQLKSVYQSNYMEHSRKDSWLEPLEEDAPNKEERDHNGLASDDTAATHADLSQISQSNERKRDGPREINTEIRNTPTPLPPPATSSQDIKPKIEDTGSTSSHTDNLSSSQTGHCGQPFATGNTRNADTPIKQESTDATCDGPPTKSPNVLVECKYENTEATASGHDAAQSQVMNLDTRVPQTTQASDITQSSDMVEAPSSQPSTSCDLDTMDLDQLRREKIKMEIKVLRLQEKYYSLKIEKLEK